MEPATAFAALNFAGSMFQNQQNREAASAAQQFGADSFASRYQTTVKDMQKAGLNPMLAYSQGGGSPPTGVSYQAQNPGQAASQGYVSAANLQQQGEALEAGAMASRASAWKAEVDTQLVKRQTEEIVQRMESNLPEALKKLQAAQAGASDTQADLNVSNIQLNAYKREVLFETAQNLVQMQKLNMQKGLTEAQSREVMLKTIQKLTKETELLDFDISAAESVGNLGREAGQLKPVIDLLLRSMKR